MEGDGRWETSEAEVVIQEAVCCHCNYWPPPSRCTVIRQQFITVFSKNTITNSCCINNRFLNSPLNRRRYSDSAKGWKTEESWFSSRQWQETLIFSIEFRSALGCNSGPLNGYVGLLLRGVKRPGHEADHSPPYSNERSYTCTPPILHGEHE